MRSASALRFSKGCSSLNLDRILMVDEGGRRSGFLKSTRVSWWMTMLLLLVWSEGGGLDGGEVKAGERRGAEHESTLKGGGESAVGAWSAS